jgi:hypothetical protein
MNFRLHHVVVVSAMIATVILLGVHLRVQAILVESFARNGIATCELEECVACDAIEMNDMVLH